MYKLLPANMQLKCLIANKEVRDGSQLHQKVRWTRSKKK